MCSKWKLFLWMGARVRENYFLESWNSMQINCKFRFEWLNFLHLPSYKIVRWARDDIKNWFYDNFADFDFSHRIKYENFEKSPYDGANSWIQFYDSNQNYSMSCENSNSYFITENIKILNTKLAWMIQLTNEFKWKITSEKKLSSGDKVWKFRNCNYN